MTSCILIVEDEPLNIKLLRDILTASGYRTLEECDGQSGIEAARRHRPDLILMDIRMPVMDGIQATRIIKSDADLCHIPVLALTGYGMECDIRHILDAGCDGYIPKPFPIREILAAVRNILSKQENPRE